MAFADTLSLDALTRVMADPRVQMGLQLLAAGGPQATRMSTGQRLAQAGQGFAQNQMQQQQLAQAQQLQQMRAQQMQQQQQQAISAQQLAERMRDPAFADSLPPQSRALAQAGATPEQVFRLYGLESQLEQQRAQAQQTQAWHDQQLEMQRQQLAQRQSGGASGHQPTPRQTLDEPLPNGMVQRHIYDAATGQYKPYGAPFQRGQAQGGDVLSQLLGGLPAGGPGVPGATADQLPPGESATQATVPGLPGTGGLQSYAPRTRQVPAPLIGGGPVEVQAPPIAAAGGGATQARPISRVPAGVPSAPQIAKPQTQAEYDALPSGALFLDPDSGRTMRKP